ncbi:MAG: SLBB domain-containing protein [candidate division Zixibacteria bacterium]|nr:SLBB domain-containing protein [candidate division Zixibacteria bacterium]
MSNRGDISYRPFPLVLGSLSFLFLLSVYVKAESDPPNNIATQMESITKTHASFVRPINPDQFLIRPGEKLTVTFIKTQLSSLRLIVDAEGRIIHENIGMLEVGGMTLSQVRELLKAELKKAYTTEQIIISIDEPALVAITIFGAVAKPGTYSLYNSQSVSVLIDSARGILPGGSRRRIELSGGPGTLTVDLDKAQFAGQFTSDPYLYSGISVFVPGQDEKVVQLTGEVRTSRTIELMGGESLAQLISYAGGLTIRADTANAYCLRKDGQKVGVKEGFHSKDIIVIPSQALSSDSKSLQIFGAVEKPGFYSLSENMSIDDLLKIAGGVSGDGNISRIVVFRETERSPWEHSESGRYPIRVTANGTQSSMLLSASDSIFVPQRVGYVKVSGEVKRPGLYLFGESKNAKNYIDLAGGFVSTANRSHLGMFDRIAQTTDIISPESYVGDGDELIVYGQEETL